MTRELTSVSSTREQQFTGEMLDLIKMLNSEKHKALILYLIPENEYPKQYIIQLLSEMASRGYLCLCSFSDTRGKDSIETLEQNLISVHHGFYLIPVIKSLSAIVLSTQNIHPDWAEALHHKLLWFHADGDSLSDGSMSDIFNKADLISYFPTNEKIEERFSSDKRSLSLKVGEGNYLNPILLEEKLQSFPKAWQTYANPNLQGKIAVMTATFLDFEGEYFYSGGAERYLLDLAKICEELQKELVIFQYGNYPWMRRFQNIDIISLSRYGLRPEGWIIKCAKEFNHIFYEHVQERTALNIYSAFFEAWPLAA